MDSVCDRCALACCSGVSLAGCGGFFFVVVATGLGVFRMTGVTVDILFCANPSAAANKVSAMVFMIPLSYVLCYLLGLLPAAGASERRRGDDLFHSIHDRSVRRRVIGITSLDICPYVNARAGV